MWEGLGVWCSGCGAGSVKKVGKKIKRNKRINRSNEDRKIDYEEE